MIFLIYLKVIIVLSILSSCGIVIIRRCVSDAKAQLVIPLGLIFGFALYLFLVNLLAHIVKGPPLFLISLGIELLITIVIRSLVKSEIIEYPQSAERLLWVINLFFWGIFLIIITNTSPFDGSDNTFYYSQASVFLRGDFPIHTPWQPDYVSYSHLGISQLLASLRFLTGASYHFLHALIAFIALFSSIQILSWILSIKDSKWLKVLFSLPVLIGFISLGAFMITWPDRFAFPDFQQGFLGWLSKLPTIEASKASAGFLDPLIYILHRLVSTSFFLGIIALLIYLLKRNLYLSIAVIIVFLSSIALLDESVLIAILPAVFLTSLFHLGKKFKPWIILISITLFVIAAQGGIVTESIINRYHSGSGVLILPKDNPDNPYENFRTWRLDLQSSTFFPDLPKYQPFRWFQVGIIYQLLLLSICTFFVLRKKGQDSHLNTFKYLLAYFLISSVVSLFAFHILVPKLFHTNGWRFLALSYQFSGIGIGFFIIYWFLNNKNIILKFLIIWVLIFSIIPPFARLFPRRDDLSWFKIHPEVKRASFEWIKNNLPVEKRVVALTDSGTVPSTNMDLATQIGVFTPVYGPKIRAYENFDAGPSYVDLYFTLNPKILKEMKIDYLFTNDQYYSKLPDQRRQDLSNPLYFQLVYSDPYEKILKVLSPYIESATDLEAPLDKLEKIAPIAGTIYIDQASIEFYRAVVMTLRERDIYGEHNYWSRVEGKIPILGRLDKYDYLILGSVDPRPFCNCDAELMWQSNEAKIKLWKTK